VDASAGDLDEKKTVEALKPQRVDREEIHCDETSRLRANELAPSRSRARAHRPKMYVRSIKEECLDRIIPLGERNFRRAVREYVVYYHLERNHQGLGMR
jgi:hypothetical protein